MALVEPQTGSKITPMFPEKLKGYVQLSGVCDASVHEDLQREDPTCDDKSVEPETFKRHFQDSSDCGNDSFVISGFEEDSSEMELQASSNAEEPKVTGDSMAQSMKKIVEEEEDDDDDTTSFCLICNKNGYHMTTMCPDREKAYVMVCEVCHAPYPCENKDVHGGEGEYRLNYCYYCCTMGHMPKMCPVDYDSDMAFDPPDDW